MRFSISEPRVPTKNLHSLAKLWGGSGDLIEWLGPDPDTPEIAWSARLIRAKVARIVLSRFQLRWLKHLPKSSSLWEDLLGQQISRSPARLDYPTAHTDWAATISEFGRYPAETYIERRPIASFDTPYSRVIRAVAGLVLKADDLVTKELATAELSKSTRAMFASLLQLPAVQAATQEARPSSFDLAVCRAAGGVWLILAKLADELKAIWETSAVEQILKLAPILPQFSHQLFELSTVGAIVDRLRKETVGSWKSESPIGAAQKGRPCLSWYGEEAHIQLYYQSVPSASRSKTTPYAATASSIGGVLRPDIWIEMTRGSKRIQTVIECKFSLNRSYVASGVTQSMAYSLEFPTPDNTKRRHVSVGPAEVLAEATSDGTGFHLCDPDHVAALVWEDFSSLLV